MSEDKLCFYSKSKDVFPGKCSGEYVEDPNLYSDLKNISNWRKMLSNFHFYPFKYQGYTYNTIEHVFQAKKIELVCKEKALWFTVESGHEIGQADGEVARKNRKLCKLTPEQLKIWNDIKVHVMYEAAVEKYKVCREANEVLYATGSAELWHIVPRSKPVRFEHLERIRNNMLI